MQVVSISNAFNVMYVDTINIFCTQYVCNGMHVNAVNLQCRF